MGKELDYVRDCCNRVIDQAFFVMLNDKAKITYLKELCEEVKTDMINREWCHRVDCKVNRNESGIDVDIVIMPVPPSFEFKTVVVRVDVKSGDMDDNWECGCCGAMNLGITNVCVPCSRKAEDDASGKA